MRQILRGFSTVFTVCATSLNVAFAATELSDIYAIVGDLSPAIALSRDTNAWRPTMNEILIGTLSDAPDAVSSDKQLKALTIVVDATGFEGLELSDCRRRFEMPWPEYARFLTSYGNKPPLTSLWENNLGGDSKGQFIRLQSGSCKATLIVGLRFHYDPAIGFMGKRNPLSGYSFAQSDTIKLGKIIFTLGAEKREIYFIARHIDLGKTHASRLATAPQLPTKRSTSDGTLDKAKTNEGVSRLEQQASEMKTEILKQTVSTAAEEGKSALAATIIQTLADCIQAVGAVTKETCKEFQARAYRLPQSRADRANSVQNWDIVFSYLGRGRVYNGTHLDKPPDMTWKEITGCATWINTDTKWELDKQKNPHYRSDAINCGNFSAQRYYDLQTLKPFKSR